MKFPVAAAAATLLSAVIAAPAPQQNEIRETVSIKDFTAHKAIVEGTTDGPISDISFTVAGSTKEGTFALVCQATATADKPLSGRANFFECNNNENFIYRFTVGEVSSNDSYKITLFHQLATAFGFWGEFEVPTYCRAGGNGSQICQQIADVNAGLHL